MKIEWIKLSVKGLEGSLQKGVSGSYAALFEKKVIVAGGSNFPDKLGFEGGQKAFYNEITQYNSVKNIWKIVGELPQKSAYGISVPLGDDFLWLGGTSDNETLSESYRISLSENSLQISNFTKLPCPMDNFAGCSSGNKIFIGGGIQNGKPSNSFYFLDSKDYQNKWEKLPDFTGMARVQPVMVPMKLSGKEYVYLLGGFFGGDALKEPQIADEVLRYSVSDGSWEKVTEQIDPITKELFSLGGATAMPIDNRYILCFGGVNYKVFLKAIRHLHHIANNNSISEEEKQLKNKSFLKEYLTQPVDYYKFNSECRVLDTHTNTWKIISTTPHVARAGATIVYDKNTFYLIQGEQKPGVRSPITWKGVITY